MKSYINNLEDAWGGDFSKVGNSLFGSRLKPSNVKKFKKFTKYFVRAYTGR